MDDQKSWTKTTTPHFEDARAQARARTGLGPKMQIITGPILIGHPDDPFIGTVSRLHDPVPVVTGGDAEEREEGHAERAKVRVLPEALARVVFIAACEAEGIFGLTGLTLSRVSTYPNGQTFPRPRRQR